jgi:hypothetical protein
MKGKPLQSTLPLARRPRAAGSIANLLAALILGAWPSAPLKAQVLRIEKSVLLSWPQNTAEEQIVVGAASIDGPWVPCLDPIFSGQGKVAMAVPITSGEQWLRPEQYFKLAPGLQLRDDFSDTNRLWSVCQTTGDAGNFQASHSGGSLRITAPAAPNWNRAGIGPWPLPTPDNLRHADFAMSVDIQEWNENAAEMWFALVARTTPLPDCSRLSQSSTYFGEIGFRRGSPTVQIYGIPPNAPISGARSIALDPRKGCRLVFSGVGNRLTLQLFARDNPGTPLVEVKATNSALSQGIPGLWVAAVNGAYDVTIDNHIVSGTKP